MSTYGNEVLAIDAKLAELGGGANGVGGDAGRKGSFEDKLAKVNERNRKANLEAVRKAEAEAAERRKKERRAIFVAAQKKRALARGRKLGYRACWNVFTRVPRAILLIPLVVRVVCRRPSVQFIMTARDSQDAFYTCPKNTTSGDAVLFAYAPVSSVVSP